MNSDSIEEWQLLSFFEVEPKLDDPDLPWHYNSALYETRIGGYFVSFSLSPSYLDFTLKIEHEGDCLYEFTALQADAVLYKKEYGKEYLEIILSGNHSLELTLRPKVRIRQKSEPMV